MTLSVTCMGVTTNWPSSSNASATDWRPAPALTGKSAFRQPIRESRKAVFVGDLVDRGPGVAEVLKGVMAMVSDGVALCVAGNHESKLVRKLRGRNVQVSHGLAESLAQLELESPAFRQRVAEFLEGLISHYVLDDGGLVVVHAGMKAEYQGRASVRVRDFCLYGETTGETDGSFHAPSVCGTHAALTRRRYGLTVMWIVRPRQKLKKPCVAELLEGLAPPAPSNRMTWTTGKSAHDLPRRSRQTLPNEHAIGRRARAVPGRPERRGQRSPFSETAQRAFYRRWAEMMDTRTWAELQGTS